VFYESELDILKGSHEYPSLTWAPDNGQSRANGNQLLQDNEHNQEPIGTKMSGRVSWALEIVDIKFVDAPIELKGPCFNGITKDWFCFNLQLVFFVVLAKDQSDGGKVKNLKRCPVDNLEMTRIPTIN
jgi:hypothetical protein